MITCECLCNLQIRTFSVCSKYQDDRIASCFVFMCWPVPLPKILTSRLPHSWEDLWLGSCRPFFGLFLLPIQLTCCYFFAVLARWRPERYWYRDVRRIKSQGSSKSSLVLFPKHLKNRILGCYVSAKLRKTWRKHHWTAFCRPFSVCFQELLYGQYF